MFVFVLIIMYIFFALCNMNQVQLAESRDTQADCESVTGESGRLTEDK